MKKKEFWLLFVNIFMFVVSAIVGVVFQDIIESRYIATIFIIACLLFLISFSSLHEIREIHNGKNHIIGTLKIYKHYCERKGKLGKYLNLQQKMAKLSMIGGTAFFMVGLIFALLRLIFY